jgi:hypothetical protein
VAPEPVTVCGQCSDALHANRAAWVHTTAEFPALRPVVDGAVEDRSRTPRRATLPGDVHCSMCKKSGAQVKKILAQGDLRLCNECTALCADIFEAELGEDWR